MDVRKCAAMVAMAESKNTSDEQLRVLSRRNLSPLPSGGELSTLKDAAKDTLASKEILDALDIAQNYIKRFRGIEANFEKVDDDKKRIIMAAKAVAYSAACSAQVRLAKAMLKAAPLKDTTIFGARSQEAE
jgi:hypothetical protein